MRTQFFTFDPMRFNASAKAGLRRLLDLFLVVWLAATVNFFIPHMLDRNPVAERLAQVAAQSGSSASGMSELVASYEQRFGLDRPLWKQYISYLTDVLQGDLGYSIAYFPMKVSDQIAAALPWSIGLLGLATLISFVIGTVLGALAGRRPPNTVARWLSPFFMVLSAIPFYLVGLMLVYFVGFKWRLLPTSGGLSLGALPSWNWATVGDIAVHGLLPALSIVLASIGFWSLGMRGMMATIEGEDYMNFAEAKGLSKTRIFYAYALRNALLPQITTLALSLGKIVTGAILVEVVFGYPGIGNLLFDAIKLSDYFTLYGCVLVIVLTVAISMLLVDLMYPFLDPRTKARHA